MRNAKAWDQRGESLILYNVYVLKGVRLCHRTFSPTSDEGRIIAKLETCAVDLEEDMVNRRVLPLPVPRQSEYILLGANWVGRDNGHAQI